MLEAHSLTKYYNRIAAVSGVSLTIQPRENSWFPGRQQSRQEHYGVAILLGVLCNSVALVLCLAALFCG